MLPRFEWSINLGHVLTIVALLAAAFGSLSGFHDRQRVHTEQLKAIDSWIARHETTAATNLEVLQELRTQTRLTTAQLESLTGRIGRLETRR